LRKFQLQISKSKSPGFFKMGQIRIANVLWKRLLTVHSGHILHGRFNDMFEMTKGVEGHINDKN
jgi:hypothetical protein